MVKLEDGKAKGGDNSGKIKTNRNGRLKKGATTLRTIHIVIGLA